MDKFLKGEQHIRKISSKLYLQLKNIHQIRRRLDFASAKTMVQGIIMSKLDYCNSLLERKKLSKLKNDKKPKRLVKTLHKILEETSTDNMDLTTINQMQYTAASLITNKIPPPKPATNR